MKKLIVILCLLTIPAMAEMRCKEIKESGSKSWHVEECYSDRLLCINFYGYDAMGSTCFKK